MQGNIKFLFKISKKELYFCWHEWPVCLAGLITSS
jgi:hypothetical protein